MNFMEALEQLQAGIPLHRESWTPEQGYIQLMPGVSTVWKLLLGATVNASNHLWLVEDFLAEDWQKFEYVAPKPLEEIPAAE